MASEEVSLSIQETNKYVFEMDQAPVCQVAFLIVICCQYRRLRASLGLKPLSDEPSKPAKPAARKEEVG